jgi:hypothetical protein
LRLSLSRYKIEILMHVIHVDGQMKAFALWSSWIAGKRGRTP